MPNIEGITVRNVHIIDRRHPPSNDATCVAMILLLHKENIIMTQFYNK